MDTHNESPTSPPCRCGFVYDWLEKHQVYFDNLEYTYNLNISPQPVMNSAEQPAAVTNCGARKERRKRSVNYRAASIFYKPKLFKIEPELSEEESESEEDSEYSGESESFEEETKSCEEDFQSFHLEIEGEQETLNIEDHAPYSGEEVTTADQKPSYLEAEQPCAEVEPQYVEPGPYYEYTQQTTYYWNPELQYCQDPSLEPSHFGQQTTYYSEPVDYYGQDTHYIPKPPYYAPVPLFYGPAAFQS